jgi:hypothetical protein
MPWTAAAIVGGALLGNDAQRSAANKAADATREANAAAAAQQDKTLEANKPALDARNWALEQLRAQLGKMSAGGPTQAEVMASPGYQFGLDQGQKQLTAVANARGMRNSGQALAGATQFGNDYATTKYDQAFNRSQAGLNPLLSVAGLGQTAANVNAQNGFGTAGLIGNNLTNNASYQGAAGIAGANNWANTGNQLAGWYANQNRGSSGGNGVNMGTNSWSSDQYADPYYTGP